MHNKFRTSFGIILIILVAGILRFYNLMHDAPYFFNPDERNMANAITQFRLPADISNLPICLISQISPNSNLQPTNYKLQTDCNLNPHFFAYGQFPLYLSFFTDQTTQLMNNVTIKQFNNYLSTSFPSAIFYLRFYSALSSTLTILLVYLITKELFKNLKINSWNLFGIWNLEIGYYAAVIAAFTPGLIQAAHFGTTESLLTFFFMASLYLSLKILNNNSKIPTSHFHISLPISHILLLSLVLGLSLGTKLTGIFFVIPPLLSIMVRFMVLFKMSGKYKNRITVALEHCIIGILLLLGTSLFFILSSPYNFIDVEGFKGAVFGYEADVAIGRYGAFYTRQFVDTIPIFFQSEKIFPYALGWPMFIFGSLGLLLITLRLLGSKKIYPPFFIFTFSFLIYLLPNSILFTKWTRFMTPIFPFFSIFAAYFLGYCLPRRRDTTLVRLLAERKDPVIRRDKLRPWEWRAFYWGLIGLLVLIGSITPGMAYMSIYTHPDTRVQASEWIYKNIPGEAYILSETGNVVDIPLFLPSYNLPPTTYNLNVISFDFYHLDENPLLFTDLINHLDKADYIFIPSRRIFANYTRFPYKYPLVTKYYQLLFSGQIGFEEITRINSLPRLEFGILNLEFDDERSEETWTVFDHPVIRIYKKTKPLTHQDYSSLFEN